MQTESTIKEKLISITKTITNYKNLEENFEKNQKLILYFIISESKRAISFVSLIEDEFEIDFDDDELDMEFFSSFDHIIELIKDHINNDLS